MYAMIILKVSGYLHPLKTISKVVSRYFITNKWNLSVSRGRLIGVVHSIIHVKSDDDCFAVLLIPLIWYKSCCAG